jgi:hypothetical protein
MLTSGSNPLILWGPGFTGHPLVNRPMKRVRGKTNSESSEHPAIVDAELWEAVNADFSDRRRTKTEAVRSLQNAT